jgi:hypothetical protein
VLWRTLTEGTSHLRDKGADPEHRVPVDRKVVGPARGSLVEVYGAAPNRAKAKRRKAMGPQGEQAFSSEAQYPPGGPA